VTSPGKVLSQTAQPFEFIEPRDPGMETRLEGDQLTISVNYPVNGLVLSTPGGEDDVSWSDNRFGRVPGHPYTVEASGLNERPRIWEGSRRGQQGRKVVTSGMCTDQIGNRIATMKFYMRWIGIKLVTLHKYVRLLYPSFPLVSGHLPWVVKRPSDPYMGRERNRAGTYGQWHREVLVRCPADDSPLRQRL
jgi:hypothetical protein